MLPRRTQINRLFPVTLSDTILSDAFWTPKLKVLATVTTNDVFDKFEIDGAFANFDRIAQGQIGDHRGSPWFDGLIYETIRAASDFLAARYDAQLDARLDAYIERIASAQAVDEDGYINTYVGLVCPEKRWGVNGGDQLWNHEEYNGGCLVEAGVHHYLATGKLTLLTMGVRFASYMCRYMGSTPKHNIVPSHSLPEEALIKLYRLLCDEPSLANRIPEVGNPKKYLALARFWIDNRGNHAGRINFTEYAQDHCPLVDQPEAVGHSVRATLLYTGLAALAREVGTQKYYKASDRLWKDVVERKMFITGGIGPIKEYEGFGYGYYLPNSGYIETCAAAGLAFWASQMNKSFGSAGYMDVYERVIYNTALAGVALAGNEYSYENPLNTEGATLRWQWHKCPCCPPMLLKLFAEMPGLIYTHDGNNIFVNLYIGSRGKVALKSGITEVLTETRYPWDGVVKVTLDQKTPRKYALHLRIPAWCMGYHITVNDDVQIIDTTSRGYASVKRWWRAGDEIKLEMEMPIERIVGHPFVGAIRERVALQRGPVVYCVEGVDNPLPTEPVLSEISHIEAQYCAELLGGVITLTAEDVVRGKFSAVPYFAWGNRQPSTPDQNWLLVWLKHDGWLPARKHLDDDRSSWENLLYRPLRATS